MAEPSEPSGQSATDRYLVALPEGVLQWLCTPVASCERALMLHILSHPNGCKVDVKSLSRQLGADVKELGKALFALNRSQSVRVQTLSQAFETRSPWVGLVEQLAAMAHRAGLSGIALADPFGLCVASARLTDIQAQFLAAARCPGPDPQPVQQVPLFVDDSRQAFSVCSLGGAIGKDDPGWVALGHCLVALFQRPALPALAVAPEPHL